MSAERESAAVPAIEIVDVWINPDRASAKLGSVDVVVAPLAIRFAGCSVTRTQHGFFVHMPSAPMLGKDGALLRDERGKGQYKPAAVWLDKKIARRFSEAVLSAIRTRCPTMLEAGSHEARA